MSKTLELIYKEACEAADKAAREWLANAKPQFAVYSDKMDGNPAQFSGTLLDLCGNAHLCAKGNTQLGRWAKKRWNRAYSTGTVVDIKAGFEWSRRQERGLMMAACRAAQAVYNAYNLPTHIWDYID